MKQEELLTLRDILTKFKNGAVPMEIVEAHVEEMIEDARESVRPVLECSLPCDV